MASRGYVDMYIHIYSTRIKKKGLWIDRIEELEGWNEEKERRKWCKYSKKI